jgi:hypothetical protein
MRTRAEWEAYFTELSDEYHNRRRSLPFALPQGVEFGAEYDASIVKEVQSRLNSLGAYTLTADGILGPKTTAALKDFQKAAGITVDGLLGPQTFAALGMTNVAHAHGPQVEIPYRNTPLTPPDAAKALSQGFQKVTGKAPNVDVLKLMIGQSALETGNWQKLPNYNFGGQKASGSDAYIQYFDTTEVVDGVTQPMRLAFAAFKDAASGAAAYVKMLQSRAHWWNGLLSGDFQAFNDGLTTAPAWYTADPQGYLAGMMDRGNNFLALAEQYAVPIGLGIGGVVAIGLGLGLGVYWMNEAGMFKPHRATVSQSRSHERPSNILTVREQLAPGWWKKRPSGA